MKWYTDMKVVMGVVLAGGLACLILGIFWGKSIEVRRQVESLELVVHILEMNREINETQNRTDSLIIANINSIYKYLDIKWEVGSVKQDTTITNDSFWGPDPIPPPAGLEMLIDRSIYRKIKKSK